MSYELQGFVEKQAQRTIRKHNLLIYRRNRELAKLEKRTGRKRKDVPSTSPSRWFMDQQFNPFYVRNKAASLSHAIEAAIRARAYKPRPAVDISIPKPTGGSRTISVYTVPDAAVGTWLYDRLRTKNRSLLSEYAFGYRPDKNANDAVQRIATAIRGASRLFVVEYDFAKFFDSIDHGYLLKVLKTHFQTTIEERAVLRALLSGKSGNEEHYKSKTFNTRVAGIPQGNTISLFLANAVCYELDTALEELGVIFARYADDVVVLTRSYSKACRAAEAILDWSARSRVKVNAKKSDGISLLIPEGTGEIKSKNSLLFLGCEISKDGVAPGEKRIARLKRKLSLIVYHHLVQAPLKRRFNRKRIQSNVDWDLVTCVNEIRRVFYGRLKETDITDGLAGDDHLKPILSHMTGFAIVDIPDRFRELDGWLVGVLERAYAMRAALASKSKVKALKLTRKTVISGEWYKFDKFPNETALPSSFRAWLYIRKYVRSRGIRALPAPRYSY